MARRAGSRPKRRLAYLRIAERFVAHGEFRLDGWTQMSFVGQAVLAWPAGSAFGSSIVTYQLTVAVLGAVGLLALWWTIRRWLAPRAAAVVLALTVAGPLYASLAISFMTDVPTFAASSVCILAAVRLTDGFSWRWFGAMCVSGLLAGSIREYGFVALAVGLLAVLSGKLPTNRRVVLASSMSVAFAAVGVLAWRRTLDGGPATRPTFALDQLIEGFDEVARGAVTLALLVAPVAVAGLGRRVWDLVRGPMSHRSLTSLAAALIVWSFVVWRSALDFAGNYVAARGSYVPLIEGALPAAVPGGLLAAARLVAAVSLFGIFVEVAMWVRGIRARRWTLPTATGRIVPWSTPRGVVAATLALTLGVHAALSLFSDAPFFDRYLLAPAAWTAALLADRAPIRHRVGLPISGLAGAAALVLVLVSGRLVGAAAALDGGAWRAGERLAESVDARTIDAGFAWFGYHQEGQVRFRTVAGRNWWTSFYPDQIVCVTVSAQASNDPPTAFGLLGPRYEFVATPSEDGRCETVECDCGQE